MKSVYITDAAVCLPNEPVVNEEMEKLLGMINNVPSRAKKIILRNNRIKTRHYAIDPTTGRPTHTNVQMTAEAIRGLLLFGGGGSAEIECLCCGTSTPDTLLPGHGVMVHGELGTAPCEVMTAAGICLSALTALKYGYMNVAMGLVGNAVCTGSELASSFTNAGFCGAAFSGESDVEGSPHLAFNKDFLRWMLSDGAGALLLTGERPTSGTGLRIDWIEQVSFAGELQTCMYAGGRKNGDGTVTGWRRFGSLEKAMEGGAFLIQQDVKLLNQEIMYTAGERTLPRIIKKHNLSAGDVDWYLPHYSSDYFRLRLFEHMKNAGLEIPLEKWFTNLESKGNTGSAAPFIILEEFMHSGRLKPGERVLCFIPESGRFSMGYMLLTAV